TALRFLANRHEALRLQVTGGDSAWRQRCVDGKVVESARVLDAIDLSSIPPGERREAAIDEQLERLAASIDLSSPPLVRGACIDLGAGRPQRLILALHHFACDAVALEVLLEELQAAYEQLERTGTAHLPPVATSLGQ